MFEFTLRLRCRFLTGELWRGDIPSVDIENYPWIGREVAWCVHIQNTFRPTGNLNLAPHSHCSVAPHFSLLCLVCGIPIRFMRIAGTTR